MVFLKRIQNIENIGHQIPLAMNTEHSVYNKIEEKIRTKNQHFFCH